MTSTSEQLILVSLDCPHFAVLSELDYETLIDYCNREDPETWQFLLQAYSEPRSSLENLRKFSPTRFVRDERQCGRAECLVHSQPRVTGLRNLHAGLVEYFNTRKALYLQLAKEYFDLLPFLGARTINGLLSKIAHQHFSIETQHWTLDPFFESWQIAATAMNFRPSTDGDEALGHVRHALKYLVLGVADMKQLMEDIWSLKYLVGRFPEESGLERTDRKQVFANASRAAWEKRMSGFEHFGVNVRSVKRPSPESLEWQDEDEEMSTPWEAHREV
ncbi:hypothetical protein PRZ48_005628 [Zasmidium cellare]|uniref:Uncharacterized protein n=1 Tax=Zasmidium cellare TaxID=395010 RepID=A0ABR0ELW7_ZASCE|nr:hypothetical protein PRZ48_005628 [Zasmidium cellare]